MSVSDSYGVKEITSRLRLTHSVGTVVQSIKPVYNISLTIWLIFQKIGKKTDAHSGDLRLKPKGIGRVFQSQSGAVLKVVFHRNFWNSPVFLIVMGRIGLLKSVKINQK